jgi:hypothetical protein
MRAMMKPIGSSCGKKALLAKVSAKRMMFTETRAAAGKRDRWRGPTKTRAI